MSKRILVVKSINHQLLIRQAVADSCLLATEQPALRRQELYTGFYTKRERLYLTMRNNAAMRVWLKRNTNLAKASVGYYHCTIPVKPGEVSVSVGRSHSRDEVFVMKMERRASVIQSKLFLNTTGD